MRLNPDGQELLEIGKQLADKTGQESCVVVGQFVGILPSQEDRTLKVFVYADRLSRMERLVVKYGLNPGDASKYLAMEEIHRVKNYESYSETKWDDMEPYDLTINSASLGIDSAVELIRSAITRC
ncbi:Cytidylate kinase [bioreactor metagenome]|uniref:Cytidylate kinase n=1 Tax=bioreactor metagenome TaxID=1076179 RepID=A0A645I7D0_9ZZZZ